MTFESQQKSVQDNGSYEGAKIYCLQKLEPEQRRFCDTLTTMLRIVAVMIMIVVLLVTVMILIVIVIMIVTR